jgi:spore maturation protein SpmB
VDSFGGSCYVIQHSLQLSIFSPLWALRLGLESETVSVELAELLAQGVSCGVAAAVGSAPVSGSLSRSLVSRMTGTTTGLYRHGPLLDLYATVHEHNESYA